jgi:hypothetical protein
MGDCETMRGISIGQREKEKPEARSQESGEKKNRRTKSVEAVSALSF